MLKKTTCLLVSFATAGAVYAGEIIPGTVPLQMFGTDGQNHWQSLPGKVPFDEFGNFSWGRSLPPQATPSFEVKDLVIEGNIDPVLSVGFTVTNNSASTQTYTFGFTLPIAPAVTPSSLNGGSTAITVTDNNNNGATVGASLGPDLFYTAKIDGFDYETIDLLSSDLTAGIAGTASRNGSFGEPIPTQPGPAALSTIGLQYSFTLTPGDSASVTGVYVVEPIPEPGSIALVAAGMVMLARRRRR